MGSAGQIQRIQLSRGLYREPRILLAHRPNTIRTADRVMVVQDGTEIEDRVPHLSEGRDYER